jgi:hypothetical protein
VILGSVSLYPPVSDSANLGDYTEEGDGWRGCDRSLHTALEACPVSKAAGKRKTGLHGQWTT